MNKHPHPNGSLSVHGSDDRDIRGRQIYQQLPSTGDGTVQGDTWEITV